MSKIATVWSRRPVVLTAVLAIGVLAPAFGQAITDWRHVGNSLIDLGLAGLASGPADRVWYSADGSRLYVRTSSGKVFETDDLERWRSSTAVAPPAVVRNFATVPEAGASGRVPSGPTPRAYAVGRFVHRSDDDGRHWENVTGFRSSSILGNGLRDLAVHPSNEDEIVVAGAAGVFRSADGGRSWIGLNQSLPNLPVARIRGLPSGGRGARLEMADASMIEWQPGERTAWKADDNTEAITELSLRQVLSTQLSSPLTAVTIAGQFVYAGTADGVISVSPDGARGVWQRFTLRDAGAVIRFWLNPADARIAVATVGSAGAGRVVRSINGGAFWDDITADLPAAPIYGVTADGASGAVYVATRRGVFFTRTDLTALGPPTPWIRLSGLPEARVMDVQLDPGGNQLWAAVEGYGAFVTLAPHRVGDPRIVSAADFVARAAAPGSLMSVAGSRVDVARAGNLNVPVLAATDTESQIQIPFDARGDALAILVDGAGARRQLGSLRLGATAPGIFVDRDGTPLLLDGDNGVMLDAMHPAHSRSRIQILATGLGAVTPDWPTGTAAPLDNPPRVVAGMKAWLDRVPVDVTRAVLAPGYIGFYLVEIEVPAVMNYGPAELYIEAAGEASNRVRVFIEP